MRDIKKIMVCFENCDGVEIERKYILGFNANEIKRDMTLVSNALVDTEVAERMGIYLTKEALNLKTTMLGEDTLEYYLQFNNIVSVILIYSNNDEEEIYCKWEGTDFRNNLQKWRYYDNDEAIEIKIGEEYE